MLKTLRLPPRLIKDFHGEDQRCLSAKCHHWHNGQGKPHFSFAVFLRAAERLAETFLPARVCTSVSS